jgi:hypothetical protein
MLLCSSIVCAQAVRKSIASLDPNGTEIASLRHGVSIMMQRSPTDPTSWIFQANIHATYDTPTTPQQMAAWNSCQHGSFFFFAWHRMYLFFFERILRAAAGDPRLTLPYWNYTDSRQRALPVVFRQPQNASNPLFVPNRAGPMNDGSGRLPDADVDVSRAFADIDFDTPHAAPADSFGGQTESGPVHFDAPHGDFESTPHDVVHVDIGGSPNGQCAGGWMTDPQCAARDPVFFLHHANVDRLWNRWIALGGGRQDPIADAVWTTTNFTFFDETGKSVQMTGKQIVNAATQLNYCYDDDPGCMGPGFAWSPLTNTTGFGNISRDPTWIGDFTASGRSQVLFYSPGDDNWWLGSFNGSQFTWALIGNTKGFGHRINDGRPFWIGRFSTTDRDQVLFYYPGDDNWWLGTINGAQLSWTLVGNTKGFGHAINDGRPFWIGDFNGGGRADVLFYYPGDDNWWLGTFSGTQLGWSLVGNTKGFGHRINDGRPFWTGKFSSASDQVLFYYPGDDNWWLGTINGGRLSWNLVGNTRGFGHAINDGRPFWIGNFNGAGRSDVLFYYPGDDNWWLGAVNGGQLGWSLVGNTRGFGHGIDDGRPFWTGTFNAAGRTNVLFYYPGDGNWWLSTDNTATAQFDWALVSSTREPTDIDFGDTSHDPTWIGDFTGSGHSQVLFYYPGDGNWWLGSYAVKR